MYTRGVTVGWFYGSLLVGDTDGSDPSLFRSGWSLTTMALQVHTSTRAGLGFRAGVKDYRLTYFMDDYKVIDTDLLAAFRVVPQPGVPSRYSSSLSCWTNQGRWLCWEHLRYKGR